LKDTAVISQCQKENKIAQVKAMGGFCVLPLGSLMGGLLFTKP
jgi:hypothetical protein